jgi:hypothetical protein
MESARHALFKLKTTIVMEMLANKMLIAYLKHAIMLNVRHVTQLYQHSIVMVIHALIIWTVHLPPV